MVAAAFAAGILAWAVSMKPRQVTIINDSTTVVLSGGVLHWGFGTSCVGGKAVSSYSTTSIQASIAPGKRETVTACYYDGQAAPKMLDELVLRNVGALTVRFDEGHAVEREGEVEILKNIQHGDTIRVVDDDLNPPLSEEEFRQIQLELTNFLEEGDHLYTGQFNILDMDDTETAFWKRLANQLNRGCYFKLKAMLTYAHWQKTKWFDTLRPLSPESDVDLEAVLSKEPYSVDLYWRSLERRGTGGYDEDFTMRFQLNIDPQDASQNSISATMARHEYDDEVALWGPYEVTFVDMVGVHEAIQAHILAQSTNDATFNIVDVKTESDDYPDSEWSSIEVIVRSKEQVFLRVHQDCLWGPQNERGHAQRKFEPIAGAKVQLDLIEYISKDLVDIGRPIDWTFDQYRNWYPREEQDERAPKNRAYRNFWDEVLEKKSELRKSLGHPRAGAFPFIFRF